MKINKTAFVLLVSGLFLVGCKETSNKQEENTLPKDSITNHESAAVQTTTGNLEKASFKIEGMSCAVGCASVIQNKLAKLDGVKSATVDFDSKTATVEFDNAKQTTTTIQETVEKIAKGAYKVNNMTSSKETAMVYQEPKKEEKKSCCAKGEKSCSSKEKGKEEKSKEKEASKEKEKKTSKSA